MERSSATGSRQTAPIILGYDSAVGYRLPNRTDESPFDVRNLLNATFNFQDTDSSNPTIRLGRVAILRFTLGM